ncbi:unnamed protein product [Zymoseptoria tritici ST99CH_3D7]|uniref:Phosphatidylinositol transfer protein SFH5 n=1 Tax=Zymoseptoria tritici (strain ST99CH_3D7) TaxID=1276538 RepID=A0A1X7RNK5_ZYMT9|nr:unnamed protein product [Zymoseptoria tritici ST99CH_3D7]
MADSAGSTADQANTAENNTTNEKKPEEPKSEWANLSKDHKLYQFAQALAGEDGILHTAGHNEMYGVELVAPSEGSPSPHTTLIILQKFLRANVDDLEKAKVQLSEALKWRKEYQPLKARDEVFDGDKFKGLGFVTKVRGATETKNEEDVVAINVYGAAAKDSKKVFGDTDAFVRWRVAQMEITLAELKLNEATKTIPDYGKGPDPYTAINVHDYLSVSFFRQPAEIKASSSKIIDLFQKYYPETVSYKYFVNVPLVMQWMMGAMKALMSKDSIQRMTWMTYGSELHTCLGKDLPSQYGGSGPALEETALTPKYAETAAAA